jgi:hypothetical protein
MSTTDQRIPVDRLSAMLAAAGLSVTWPPDGHDEWRAIAHCIAHLQPLPPRPTVYDPAVMRAIHAVDAATARAVMRAAAGWLQAPHGDDDFEATLGAWETEVCGNWGNGEQHWVAARYATFRLGRGRVDVARCKDCGLPVYTIENHMTGWRPIWPLAECR